MLSPIKFWYLLSYLSLSTIINLISVYQNRLLQRPRHRLFPAARSAEWMPAKLPHHYLSSSLWVHPSRLPRHILSKNLGVRPSRPPIFYASCNVTCLPHLLTGHCRLPARVSGALAHCPRRQLRWPAWLSPTALAPEAPNRCSSTLPIFCPSSVWWNVQDEFAW